MNNWVLVQGALAQGFIFAFLAWATLISLRLLRFADITVDGSLTTGAAVAAVLITRDVHPWLACLAGFAAGGLAGACTGLIHTRLGINDLLSGILVMTALYSINLRVMGRSNMALLGHPTVAEGPAWLGLSALCAGAATVVLVLLLRSDAGLALRATGDNEVMSLAQGTPTANTKVAGLAISNALAGLCGALFAQYNGAADINLGLGALVTGIAAVIVGETLLGKRSVLFLVVGALVGSVLYRFILVLAIRADVEPTDLRILTAVFVLVALAIPAWRKRRALQAGRRA